MTEDALFAGAPTFPPLLTGLAAPGDDDILAAGVAAARGGADGGTVLWSPRRDRWEVAVVFAPEDALKRSLTVALALQMAVVDAIGALAPPEVGVVWAWPDVMLVNGARAGRMRAAAETEDPAATPDWLVFALEAEIAPIGVDPGETPDRTSLAEEGCADLDARRLTEVWARHAQLWLHTWIESGLAAVEPHWRDRAFGAGAAETAFRYDGPTPAAGRFLGLDEDGGLLLRTSDGVANPPLTDLLSRSEASEPPRLAPMS